MLDAPVAAPQHRLHSGAHSPENPPGSLRKSKVAARLHQDGVMQQMPSEQRVGWCRERWLGLVGGLLVGGLDTILSLVLGIHFEAGGQDITWIGLGFYAVSFAGIGFLVGLVMEARRGERRQAAIIREQLETVDATRKRLAQSEKLAALGQLAAAVAHEVRNAFAVIRSSAQGITETLPEQDAEGRESCSFIVAEIDRLTNVVNSLLSFARPLRLSPRPVNVHQLLDHAQLLARQELDAKRIRIVRDEDAVLPPIEADSDLVVQVLLDLLSNAAQATPPGSEVRLEAQAGDDEVRIGVADAGPGVPEDLRSRIFEPFFTTRDKGTGLGLAVARQIVEAHHGRIEVGEARAGGAHFRISLPAAAVAGVAA